MPAIVTCTCGAKVRLPDERTGKALRCPQCRAEFVTTNDAQVLTFAAADHAAGAVCPVCQAGVETGAVTMTCPECKQVHHRDCWLEIGGCSTYGCSNAPALAKADVQGQPARAAWGDTKQCPACGETIKSIALRCRYCQTDFETVDPLSMGDLDKLAEKKESRKGFQTTVIALFVVSLFGCLAPLVLLVGLIWFIPRRKLAAQAGPFYVVLGYAAILVSLTYTLLIGGFLLFSNS
jgi:hypothetical protein